MSEELRVSSIETRGMPGKRRFAMVVDTRRCIGCMACQVACKAEYDTPLGVNRTWVPYKVVGKCYVPPYFRLPVPIHSRLKRGVCPALGEA